MIWIGLAFLALFGVWLLMKACKTVVYLSGPFGFMGWEFGKVAQTKATWEKARMAIDLLLSGDRFDNLHVSSRGDDRGGIVLSLAEGEVELTADFSALKDGELINAFRERFAQIGHFPSEEHAWNQGINPELEQNTLAFRLPRECEPVFDACEAALGVLDGTPAEVLFLHAWKTSDGPGLRAGIHIRHPRDLLKGQI